MFVKNYESTIFVFVAAIPSDDSLELWWNLHKAIELNRRSETKIPGHIEKLLPHATATSHPCRSILIDIYFCLILDTFSVGKEFSVLTQNSWTINLSENFFHPALHMFRYFYLYATYILLTNVSIYIRIKGLKFFKIKSAGYAATLLAMYLHQTIEFIFTLTHWELHFDCSWSLSSSDFHKLKLTLSLQ